MNLLKRCCIIFLVLSVIFIPQMVRAIGFEVAVGVWNQSPQGDISYKGDSVSLGNDLNYKSKTKFTGRAKIDMPLFIPNIYVMATPMSFDGNGNKETAFKFGEKNFVANVPVSSKITLDHYDIAFYYGIPFVKTATLGMLNIDAGLNVRIIDFKIDLSQAAISDSKSFTLPIPMAYIGAQYKPLPGFPLSLEGEIRAIAYSKNHYADLIGRVKYKVFGPAFLTAGYRYEKLKIDSNSVKADLNFGGPFAEVGVEF